MPPKPLPVLADLPDPELHVLTAGVLRLLEGCS